MHRATFNRRVVIAVVVVMMAVGYAAAGGRASSALAVDGALGQAAPTCAPPSCPPGDAAGEFTALTPARVLDTRDGTGDRHGPLAAGESLDVQIAGRGGVQPTRLLDTREWHDPLPANSYGVLTVAGWAGVPPNATAAVLNVTATEPSMPGYLTVFPDDSCVIPLASSLNFEPGESVPNLVMVRLSEPAPCTNEPGAIDIYNFAGTTHVVVDIFGYFTGE